METRNEVEESMMSRLHYVVHHAPADSRRFERWTEDYCEKIIKNDKKLLQYEIHLTSEDKQTHAVLTASQETANEICKVFRKDLETLLKESETTQETPLCQ